MYFAIQALILLIVLGLSILSILLMRLFAGVVERFSDDMRDENKFAAFVIHLPKNVERRAQFEAHYALDIPCDIIHGIDGNALDLDDMHARSILSDDGLRSILNVRRGIRRHDARQLGSPGALGLYLSHCQLWEKLVTLDDAPENMIVFEDDAIVQGWNIAMLSQALASLPDDWHIYMIGRPHSVYKDVPVGGGVHRILEFCGTHAYVIGRAGAKWLWEHGRLMPVQQQIDMKLADLISQGLRIFTHPGYPLVEFKSSHSDVQV